MSSQKLDLSEFRIGELAETLGQSQSVIKLCLQGPRPNIETGSIDGIKTVDEAKKLMKQAKSVERKRLIAKKWIEISVAMEDLIGLFGDFGAPKLYLHDDIRHLHHMKALAIADRVIADKMPGVIFHAWRAAPYGFVRDKLLLAYLEMCDNADFCSYLIEALEENGSLNCEDAQWTYWTFMQRGAELARPEKAEKLLEVIRRHNRFDHEIPTVALLVQKVAENYKY